MHHLMRVFEIGLIWAVLLVVLPVTFDRMVAGIDRLVDRRRRRPSQRPSPPAVDRHEPEAKPAGSPFSSLDVLPWL